MRRLLVESPTSLGERARARRWEVFTAAFPDLEQLRVLDLGGRLETWERAPRRPAHVHLVNLEGPVGPLPRWASFDRGDVCDVPPGVRSGRFDLVFSNSVIEHLGGLRQMACFAEVVDGLADRHWVQTPYRYFPIEPHWLFPGFQFLPLRARAVVAERWPLVHTPPRDGAAALRAAMGVELLSRTHMRALFPRSELVTERVAGLAKSLIAIRTG